MNISSNIPVTSPADLYSGASGATDRQAIVQALRVLSQANVFGENRELTFALDPSTRRTVIHVIDRETGDTVMQLPPEYVVRLAASLKQGK